MRWHSYRNRIVRYIFSDHCSCSYYDIIPNLHIFNNTYIRSNINIVSNSCRCLFVCPY